MSGDHEVGARGREEAPGIDQAPGSRASGDPGEREWQDRVTAGWSPWLTPRQMRLILCQLARMETKNLDEKDRREFLKLIEWFEIEIETKYSRRS